MSKTLHLIVACAENRVIGRDGKLPWRIPEDLKYFHDETAGQICVLGRICYETWPRVHADQRRPIVLTSRPLADLRPVAAVSAPASGVAPHPPLRARSVPEALALAETLPGGVYICGGQRIYEETFALAAAERLPLRLQLTLVHAEVPGDTYFPEWRHLRWREISRRESADANYRYTFSTLDCIWP